MTDIARAHLTRTGPEDIGNDARAPLDALGPFVLVKVTSAVPCTFDGGGGVEVLEALARLLAVHQIADRQHSCIALLPPLPALLPSHVLVDAQRHDPVRVRR